MTLSSEYVIFAANFDCRPNYAFLAVCFCNEHYNSISFSIELKLANFYISNYQCLCIVFLFLDLNIKHYLDYCIKLHGTFHFE